MPHEGLSEQVTRLFGTTIGRDPSAIAQEILADLGDMPWAEARKVLHPWLLDRVTDEVRVLQRQKDADDRFRERALARRANAEEAGISIRVRRQKGRRPDPNVQLTFLDCDVPVPGAPGGTKKYGELTIEEHRYRISVHDKVAYEHRWAVGEITAHGVVCLNEIPADILAKSLPSGGIHPQP